MVPISVSALHHRYCIVFFSTAFSLCILQGNLDVLWYGSHTLSVYGVEMRWCHFSSVFSLCFFTMDSAGNGMLSHCCFPFLPSLSSSPHFLSSPFLLTSFHVSATRVFALINLWSSGFSPLGSTSISFT